MIYTLGESLLDVIISPDGNAVTKPGGSQLNVAVSLGRSGKEVAMISEIGNDPVGKILSDFLLANGIATDLLQTYPGMKTSLALAFLDDQKKPSYSFYKMYPEKRLLSEPPAFSPEDIFIFGSMYARDQDIKEFLEEYISQARRGGAVIFYDPNIRHNHQIGKEENREMLLKNLAAADVIKGSDEDFENIFGVVSIDKMKERLRELNSEALLVITMGDKGSVAFHKDLEVSAPAPEIEVVSTIGAGDAFTAGMVNSLVGQKLTGKLHRLNEGHLKKMLSEGTRFSTMVCRSMDNYIPATG
jgi:fructokinase